MKSSKTNDHPPLTLQTLWDHPRITIEGRDIPTFPLLLRLAEYTRHCISHNNGQHDPRALSALPVCLHAVALADLIATLRAERHLEQKPELTEPAAA